MKQMDRRLLILTRLRESRPVRAVDLAGDCDCAVRTIYRDIDALCAAGVPIAAMPGEGYRLAPGYHLPPIAFTADEASVELGVCTSTIQRWLLDGILAGEQLTPGAPWRILLGDEVRKSFPVVTPRRVG